MNIPNNTLISTVPAAAQLRRVSGFNPLKFLRQTTSEKTGQTVLKLDLPYKRLWFRLACPNGRMLLNPLRITDQMAIYEAMVYMEKDDAEPLARVTSTATVAETPDGKYIESAQDSALDEALENAGFGIQLCDLIESAGRTNRGSEVILDTNAVTQAAAVQKTPETPKVQASTAQMCDPKDEENISLQAPASAQTSTPTVNQAPPPAAPPTSAPAQPEISAPVPTPAPTSASANGSGESRPSLMTQEHLSNKSASDEDSGIPSAQALPEAEQAARRETAVVSDANGTVVPGDENTVNAAAQAAAGKVQNVPAKAGSEAGIRQTVIQFPMTAPAENAPAMPLTTAQAAPSAAYTADMPVEEIVQRMTEDEAKQVIVTSGTCKGWSLAQVAERRPASLRFYLCSPNVDNILKAGAQIMLDASQRKAG